jgi:hypothetical protein
MPSWPQMTTNSVYNVGGLRWRRSEDQNSFGKQNKCNSGEIIPPPGMTMTITASLASFPPRMDAPVWIYPSLMPYKLTVLPWMFPPLGNSPPPTMMDYFLHSHISAGVFPRLALNPPPSPQDYQTYTKLHMGALASLKCDCFCSRCPPWVLDRGVTHFYRLMPGKIWGCFLKLRASNDARQTSDKWRSCKLDFDSGFSKFTMTFDLLWSRKHHFSISTVTVACISSKY